MSFLVQTGLMGEIGSFRLAQPAHFERDAEVICRTSRGLEIGRVITEDKDSELRSSGTLLRLVSPDDRLIIERIERYKDRAFRACTELLQRRKISAMLVDVEHLFDGESVYFYFLGDVPSEVNEISDQLAEIYDAKVRFRQFAEKLANGCGPGCGTTASQCGDGNCSSCGIAGGCLTKKTG